MSRSASRPLRVKLTVLVVLLLGAGLLVSSFAATAALRGYLIARVDDQLVAGSRPFADIATRLPLPVLEQADGPRPPSFFSIVVVDAAGSQVIAVPTGTEQEPPAIPDPSEIAEASGAPFTVAAADGSGQWRTLATPLADGQGWVLASLPLADVQATVGRLVLLQLAVGLTVIVIAGTVGFVLVRRSLRPLDAMAVTTHEIAEGDLTRRVSEQPTSAEVDELAASFNAMVTRIEGSFSAQQASEAQARASEERMRRFVADAGHELRTPLTSIRGYAELIEQGAAPDPAQAVERIQLEAERMGGLVDDLQLLARLDEQRPMRREPVDLATVCADAVASAGVHEPDRAMTVDIGSGSAIVMGDANRLRQVVDNLLSNAMRYSPPQAPVRLELSRQPHAAARPAILVSVRDEGPGLTAEEAERVFDRLYRTDAARSRVDGGSGLGLAIVRSIVESHGGDVFVTTAPGAGSTFGFMLPAADDAG